MTLNCRTAWVTIATKNLERSHQFYQALLNQSPVCQILDRYIEFQVTNLRLGIYVPKPQEVNLAPTSPYPSLSLCLEVADLDQAIAHLQAISAQRGEILAASHGREVYGYDPDGNRLILYEPLVD